MEITLITLAAHPLLPNLRRGDTLSIRRVSDQLQIAAAATPILLYSVMTALSDGSLAGYGASPDPGAALRHLAVSHLRLVG